MIFIYGFCVVFLLVVGKLFGWSYIDSSVYICEYFAPCVIMFVCLITFIKIVRFFIKSKFSWKWIATIIIGVLNCFLFKINLELLYDKIEKYSGHTNREIFNMVVKDLNISAANLGVDYFTMNIIVYILPFAIACIFLLLQTLLNRSYNLSLASSTC